MQNFLIFVYNRIILSTDKPEFGWNLLNNLDLSSIIDEKFILDIFLNNNLKLRQLSHLELIEFINFILTYSYSTSKMAIQKHLATYSSEKPQENENSNIDKLMKIIELCQEHNIPPSRQIEFCEILIKSLSTIPLPREPNNIKLFTAHMGKISDYFRNVSIPNDERLRFLELLYSHLPTNNNSSTTLIALGFLLIPDSMIAQAIGYFFKTLQWNGRKTEESVINSIGTLMYWLRTYMPVPLELWIVNTLSVLSSNGLNDIIDEVAKKNAHQALLSLLIPVFQTKAFPVFQALFEYSRNRKELFDIIESRILNLIKQLESTKSEIYEPLIELICETLGSFDYTEEKYKEIVSHFCF